MHIFTFGKTEKAWLVILQYFTQKCSTLKAEKYQGCWCARVVYYDFCQRRKRGTQLGPTPLASCKQCFLRNQGYCIEVEKGEETVRGEGRQACEDAVCKCTAGLWDLKMGREKVADRKWKQKRRESRGAGGRTEDKGRVEPSVWESSITVHQRAEFSRQSNLSKTQRGWYDEI